MTDPIPRRDEVEDILFSVRKLVAQEQGRKQSFAPQPSVSLPGKLVLTAELRVPSDTGQAPLPADEPVAAPAQAPERDQAPISTRSLLQRISEQAVVHEPAASEAAEPVHDTSEPAQVPVPRGATEGDDSPEDAGLEHTLARLEAMLAGNAPPAPALAQAPEQNAAVATEDRPRTPDQNGEETLEIDEAMLSQLVAHIVRRELQGELGEKITRAIRKLVRAEVARELALRKL